jgi:hypothetical protein
MLAITREATTGQGPKRLFTITAAEPANNETELSLLFVVKLRLSNFDHYPTHIRITAAQ